MANEASVAEQFVEQVLNITEVPIVYQSASRKLAADDLSESFRILWSLYRHSGAEPAACKTPR